MADGSAAGAPSPYQIQSSRQSASSPNHRYFMLGQCQPAAPLLLWTPA